MSIKYVPITSSAFLSVLLLSGCSLKSPDDSFQIIYLLILIVLIGSSVLLRYRSNYPTMLKQAGIWVILLIIVASLYQCRHSLDPIKEHMTSTFFPASPISTGNKVTIYRAADGHFHAHSKINDQSIEFLVDTGASDIVLTVKDAKKAGIDIKQLSFNRAYETANGRIFAAPVTLDSLKVGNITLHNVRASVSQSPMNGSLLGMTFLNQLDRFEVTKDSMTFYSK